ncbi:MAG: zinc-binding dehydrogenase [Gammaproteobacteria bacterium]
MSLGADQHIDYREVKFEEVLFDSDLVLDGMGGAVLENSLQVVKSGGTSVSLPTHAFPEYLQAAADQLNTNLSLFWWRPAAKT